MSLERIRECRRKSQVRLSQERIALVSKSNSALPHLNKVLELDSIK